MTKVREACKTNRSYQRLSAGYCVRDYPSETPQALNDQMPPIRDQLDTTANALPPRVKITELLLEVDEWTGFTRHFAHLKSQEVSKDSNLLLTEISRC
jgi:hypothetical protein